MIKFDKFDVYNVDRAIDGMRNSFNSHDKSDSRWVWEEDECGFPVPKLTIGENDFKRMLALVKAGPSHAKFRRQMMVCVDITAPLYFWKEYATYKVGTVENSESTMHTIHMEVFTPDLFSMEDLEDGEDAKVMWNLLMYLERLRVQHIEAKKSGDMPTAKKAWRKIIQLLPDSFNQKRTCTLNYEVLANMYHQRENHRLQEWWDFRDWCRTLPYSELITTKGVK